MIPLGWVPTPGRRPLPGGTLGSPPPDGGRRGRSTFNGDNAAPAHSEQRPQNDLQSSAEPGDRFGYGSGVQGGSSNERSEAAADPLAHEAIRWKRNASEEKGGGPGGPRGVLETQRLGDVGAQDLAGALVQT